MPPSIARQPHKTTSPALRDLGVFQHLGDGLAGLALYPETDLERLQVEVRFGQQLLESIILDLKILQA